MPFAQSFPLGGNGDILMDLVRRMEVLEGRARVIQNGSIVFTDSNNHVVMVLGQQADGTFGLSVLDTTGTIQAKLGQITASPAIYGVATLPQLTGTTGALQMVGGKVYLGMTPPGTVNTAGAWTAFAIPNSVQVNIGPSQLVSVAVTATFTAVTAGVLVQIGFSIDGGAVHTVVGLQGAANTAVILSSVEDQPLTAGAHTLEFWYQTVGGSATISSALGVIEPL